MKTNLHSQIRHNWFVETDNLIEKSTLRAVVNLALLTAKPILKLTNKDYRDNGLETLLGIYDSAYNLNIKVFNALQHTITGWPGGKPLADDSNRPERALPYPKRVIVFSPHPDDDVISMGGTLQRLVNQGHDVHVAYQVSGNIAVSDEDALRYILLMDAVAGRLGFDTSGFRKRNDEIKNFIELKQRNGGQDSTDLRYVKTMIRQGEARIACGYVGVKSKNIHFLNLPFYETGEVKKGDLTDKDIAIVKDLLSDIRPHQIFVAGDLADPHGTHKVCLDAVFAAVEQSRDELWLRDCRVWMYRGAWAEWDIDQIDMVVPLSPEELMSKRIAILKHQSQMENAPFLGDDDRLFWQRAEDRNRATAQLYAQLGLASYEAMEAFARYQP